MRNHAPVKTHKPSHAAAVQFFRDKLDFEIGPYSLKQQLDGGLDAPRVIDVRDASTYAAGHIPGAINVPQAELTKRLATLPKDKAIVTYCGDIGCPLSSKAALELAQKGYRVKHLLGGFADWKKKEYPIETYASNEGGPME